MGRCRGEVSSKKERIATFLWPVGYSILSASPRSTAIRCFSSEAIVGRQLCGRLIVVLDVCNPEPEICQHGRAHNLDWD